MTNIAKKAKPEAAASFLAGGGELGELLREHDWSETPLGDPSGWPRSLQTAVRIMLTSRQPIWIGWGRDLIYLYNDPYKSIIGGRHPWALGRPTREVWHEIWSEIGPMLATAMTGIEGTYVEAQLLIMERNGYPEETYYTFSYSPIPDDDGAPGGIICANTDDTQRVIGERQLALLQALSTRTAEARRWEQACKGIMVALAANPHDIPFALLYVAAPGETPMLAGHCGIDLSHPAAREDAWPFAQVLKSNEVCLVTDLGQRFGSELPMGAWKQAPHQAAVFPVLTDNDGTRTAVLVVGLSPFRLFDENYRGFLRLLSRQVSAALSNAQAYEDERRRAEALAEIDRAKTLFFSNVSHEFRTPLTLMLGPLEEALRTPTLEGELRGELEMSHRNALRLLKLVNSLLDFSRVEAGRAQASFGPVDLATLTADLASSFRSACERAGLKLTIECSPLDEPVYIDRDMWEKIVLNLVSNAFKFTLAGGITVALRRAGDEALLTVSDTGAGIPAHELPRIFERFHRVENAGGRTHEGTGIGLALVQELVRLHGGTVEAASTYGQGTSFTVRVPFGTAHLPAAHIGSTQVSTATHADAYVEEALRWLTGPPVNDYGANDLVADDFGAPVSLATDERPRVLLADDNADMRDYVRRLLSARWDVEVVSDGEAAWQAIVRRRPDLVLSDVMMPKLDGLSLLKAIRVDPALRDLPVILLSARAGEEASVAALDVGADDYLIKPFSARELVARVESSLKLAKVRQTTTAELQASEQRFRTIFDEAPLGIYLVDADFRLRHVNPTAWPVFGGIPDLIGRDFDEIIRILWPPNFADELVRLFRRTLETGEPYATPDQTETRYDTGVTEYYEWQIHRILLPEGRFGVVCYFRDISERKRGERRRLMLIDELNHRVKNTLATVQAVVTQTLRGQSARGTKDLSVDEVRRTIDARLIALAQSHDLLTRENWGTARLQDVATQALEPFATEGTRRRFTLEGPEIRLRPKLALALGMAFHELATNAAKYGALTNATGEVKIGWTTENGLCRLRWQEKDGPAVHPPGRKGFGSRLIERGLAHELGGTVKLDYALAGVVCDIEIPAPWGD